MSLVWFWKKEIWEVYYKGIWVRWIDENFLFEYLWIRYDVREKVLSNWK